MSICESEERAVIEICLDGAEEDFVRQEAGRLGLTATEVIRVMVQLQIMARSRLNTTEGHEAQRAAVRALRGHGR